MRNKALKAVAYSLFFLACLVFFLIQGFPVEIIGDILKKQAKQALGMKLSMNSLSTMFPNGIEATGLRLVKEAEEGKPPLTVSSDQASFRVSLFSLIAGKWDVSFSSNLLSGKAEGDFLWEAGNWRLDARLSGLNMGKLGFWPELIGQELTGKVSGSVELNVKPKDIKATRGNIALDLIQGQVGQGKVYGIQLPWVGLGKTQANLDIQKGKAEIKAFKINSDDIEASLEGYLLLQQKLENLSTKCTIQFKPSDEKLAEIRNQIPQEFRGLFDNELNRAKGRDGYYRYKLIGRLFGGNLKPRPVKQ